MADSDRQTTPSHCWTEHLKEQIKQLREEWREQEKEARHVRALEELHDRLASEVETGHSDEAAMRRVDRTAAVLDLFTLAIDAVAHRPSQVIKYVVTELCEAIIVELGKKVPGGRREQLLDIWRKPQ